MKMTKENGKIIIEFDKEDTTVGTIVHAIKEYEEALRASAEAERAFGFIGSAAVNEARADTADKILKMIDCIVSK